MEKSKKKQSHTYIFPDFLGKVMSKIDMRVQYEASMLSMSLMMIGLIVSATYLIIYIESLQTWYKIFLVGNALAGVLFMSSFLVTTYQQYQAYMEVQGWQKEENSKELKDSNITNENETVIPQEKRD